MSPHEKYLKILAAIMPAGVLGASLLLGSTAPSVANEHPAGSQPSASDQVRVSERLAAIREALSSVAQPGIGATPGDGNLQLAWEMSGTILDGVGAEEAGAGDGRGTIGATVRAGGTIGGVTGDRRLGHSRERHRDQGGVARRPADAVL